MYNKAVIVKAAREKFQVTSKGKSIRTIPDFSMEKPENLDGCAMSYERSQMPAKLSTTVKGEMKKLHNNHKFKQFLSTIPASQRAQASMLKICAN